MDDNKTLLALSDLLILTALERAWSRTVPRSQRVNMRAADRHRGYTMVPIHDHAIDKALTDAWVLTVPLAHRHHLPVNAQAWAQLLDTYTRALLQMSQQHTPQRLAPYLLALVEDDPCEDQVVFEDAPEVAARAS